MSIQIPPSSLTKAQTSITPKILTQEEKEVVNDRQSKVFIEGDIYSAKRVSFQTLKPNELKQEKIYIDSQQLTTITSNKNKTDERVLVAFRNPKDSDEVLTLKLEPKALEMLRSAFSKEDFFQRDDGILRLNADAEEYIASWYNDISHSRGYDNADANGDGKIDKNEKANLNIGFNKSFSYDYLDEKIDAINTSVTQNYARYGDTMEYANKKAGLGGMGFLNAQSINFENSIEKELSNTIIMDKNFDSKISLEEGLEDKKISDLTLNEYMVHKTKHAHLQWLQKIDYSHNKQSINTRDISLPQILSVEERENELQRWKQQMQNSLNEQAITGKLAIERLKD